MEERLWACHAKKGELRKLKPSELDLSNGIKLYINESLCPYYRVLGNQCKKLRNKQIIFSFFTVNGSIRIKIREDGPYNITTHIDDLKDVVRCAIWYYLYNLKNVENTHEGVLILVKLQAEAVVRRSSVKSWSCGVNRISEI